MYIQQGDVYQMEDGNIKHRKMTDEELKNMIGHIRLNTGFSLPDQLIQDFMNDGSIVPSFKKCVHFNRNDFNSMVQHLKVKKKKLPKRVSKRKSKSKPKAVNPKPVKPKSKPKIKRKTLKVTNEKSIKK